MVNLLKGRKQLEKVPSFPKFTTQDDAYSKFKKLVRYYNKVMEIDKVLLKVWKVIIAGIVIGQRIILVINATTLQVVMSQKVFI